MSSQESGCNCGESCKCGSTCNCGTKTKTSETTSTTKRAFVVRQTNINESFLFKENYSRYITAAKNYRCV
ncbi:896_t:CDS:2, partial [Dentiscutata erythropus]